jgi:hypothetical protein
VKRIDNDRAAVGIRCEAFDAQVVQTLSERALALATTESANLRTVQTSGSCALYAGAASLYLGTVALAAIETGPVAAAIATLSVIFGAISVICS